MFVYHGQLGLDRGTQWFELGAGDTLLMRQHQRSRAAIAYPPDLVYFWLLFEIENGTADLPERARVARPRRLADLFQLLLEDQQSGTLSSAVTRSLIDALFAEVHNLHGDGGDPSSPEESHVQRALTFIHARFRDPISTQDIADHLHLSADHLGRVFRKATGRTLVREIQHTRLREARLLLLESSDTIEQIAGECGFSDGGYFRRVFRKIEGLSPARFRAQFRR